MNIVLKTADDIGFIEKLLFLFYVSCYCLTSILWCYWKAYFYFWGELLLSAFGDWLLFKSLLIIYRHVYHITFKFCKGNTKGRRRGGRGAVPAPKENVSKNRCTLRRRVSPFSLPLGFPSALSFLTHPHLRLDFCKTSHYAFLKFSIGDGSYNAYSLLCFMVRSTDAKADIFNLKCWKYRLFFFYFNLYVGSLSSYRLQVTVTICH